MFPFKVKLKKKKNPGHCEHTVHTFLSQLHCSWFSIWLYSKTLGGDSCSVLSISKTFYPVVHQHPSYCRSQKRLHFVNQNFSLQ